MKKRTIIKILIIFLPIILNFIFIPILLNSPVIAPSDVDKIYFGPYSGKYLVTDGWGLVKIVDFDNRQVLWQTGDVDFFVHDSDMLPNGNIIVGDTGRDRIFELNLTTKEIVWEWNAKNNYHINWTDFGQKNGWNQEALSIVQDKNPCSGYYTHLNTIDFINGSEFGRSYDTILASIRNFDLVIEINYTAKKVDPAYLNISWHYGEPGNHSIIFHQHAPERLPNGNTLICDSENNRIVEINEDKELVWEYRDKKLRWVRDIDLLPWGNYLITDSSNNRIIEVNRTTKEIVRSFWVGLFTPYECDYTDDGYLITGNTLANNVVIYDYASGTIVDVIGFNYLFAPLFITILVLIVYHTGNLIYNLKELEGKSTLKKFKRRKIYSKIIIIVSLILLFIFFNHFLAYIWNYGLLHFTESVPRP
jgi:hypothetical protein